MPKMKTRISALSFRLQLKFDIRLAVEFRVLTAEVTTHLCGLGSTAV
jgi:hypothetical protein